VTYLAGLRVWITRPVHQAGGLAAAVEAAGGRVLRQPLLAIEPPHDTDAARRDLAVAEAADITVFTSANAVAGAWNLSPGWSPRGRLAAVGGGTAADLHARTRAPVLTPADYSSEGLLALDELTGVADRHVALVGGEGGRRRLDAVLRERGARVTRVAVYRRVRVAIPGPRLQALLEEADAIVITSGEALGHLEAITPVALRPRLHGRQLVVPSARVLKQAHDLGFARPPPRSAAMRAEAVVAALARGDDA
jgi:uroporphyrinogen-III synthase